MLFSKKTKWFKSILASVVVAIPLIVTGCSSNSASTPSSDTTNNSSQVESTVPGSNESTQDSSNNSDKLVSDLISNGDIPKNVTKATVTRVVDGDTYKLNIDGKEVTLRALLVDTPESVKPGVDPQPFSKEASNFAKEELGAGDTVYVEYDGNKTDKYDRHLGYVWFNCGKHSKWELFNEEIVRDGYARVGYIYDSKKYLNELYEAQDIAKHEKLNIWSIPGYVTSKGYNVDASEEKTSTKNSEPTKSNVGTPKSNSVQKKPEATVQEEPSQEQAAGDVVYANGGSSSSNKYHASSNAHGMKGSIQMSESEAKSKGYVPCGICYK